MRIQITCIPKNTCHMYLRHTADIQITCIPTVCRTYTLKYRLSVSWTYGRNTDHLDVGCISGIYIVCISDLQVKKYILPVFPRCISNIQRSKPGVYVGSCTAIPSRVPISCLVRPKLSRVLSELDRSRRRWKY